MGVVFVTVCTRMDQHEDADPLLKEEDEEDKKDEDSDDSTENNETPCYAKYSWLLWLHKHRKKIPGYGLYKLFRQVCMY